MMVIGSNVIWRLKNLHRGDVQGRRGEELTQRDVQGRQGKELTQRGRARKTW